MAILAVLLPFQLIYHSPVTIFTVTIDPHIFDSSVPPFHVMQCRAEYTLLAKEILGLSESSNNRDVACMCVCVRIWDT